MRPMTMNSHSLGVFSTVSVLELNLYMLNRRGFVQGRVYSETQQFLLHIGLRGNLLHTASLRLRARCTPPYDLDRPYSAGSFERA